MFCSCSGVAPRVATGLATINRARLLVAPSRTARYRLRTFWIAAVEAIRDFARLLAAPNGTLLRGCSWGWMLVARPTAMLRSAILAGVELAGEVAAPVRTAPKDCACNGVRTNEAEERDEGQRPHAMASLLRVCARRARRRGRKI